MGRPRIEPIGRFWAKVEITPSCWLWCGATSKLGYGQFKVRESETAESRQIGAHVFAYKMLVGSIPVGLVLDHLCRNPFCVNPDHLEPVTEKENILRGVGEGAKNAKKTHCPQGHPYNDENTEHRKSGRRRCRECSRKSCRDAYWRKLNA